MKQAAPEEVRKKKEGKEGERLKILVCSKRGRGRKKRLFEIERSAKRGG